VQTLTEIKSLLAARGIRPKHRFGQNFLHDHNQLRKLVETARVQPGELVLEVGPGTGTLTETLAEAGAEVIACEIDLDMQAIVRERLGDRVRLIAGDCLDGKHALSGELLAALGGRPFALVANLPYNAASPLMAILAGEHPECRGQYVTVQKEVADRVRAQPNTRDYGPLTVLLQLTSDVREIAVVKPGSFWPAPDVTSAMIAIEPRANKPFASTDELRRVERFTHELFSKRRKQLGGILKELGGRDGPWPEGITADLRPEALTPEQVLALMRLRAEHPSRTAS
jgi:16S rRNA (adenine1518-N6/adenine1519-N6)-dimethyltransferase